MASQPAERRRRQGRSRLALRDLLAESRLELTRRLTRTLLTGLGVAIGVAAIVITQGLVTTVRFQVTDEFNAELATQVEVRPPQEGADRPIEAAGERSDGPTDVAPATFPPSSDRLAALGGLSGVVGAGVLRDSQEQVSIALSPIGSDEDPVGYVHGLSAGAVEALGGTVSGTEWSTWHDDTRQRVALLGRKTADALGVATVTPDLIVFIDGFPFAVVGIVEDTGRARGLLTGVSVPATTASMFGLSAERDRILVVTVPGAAPDIEEVAPLALAPWDPEFYRPFSSQRSEDLQRSVDEQLQNLALALGFVVIGLGLVSIGNATLTSVLQRTSEIGLRRALGARSIHIAAHVVVDAALTGLAGAAVGTLLGFLVTAVVSIVNEWQLVVDRTVLLLTLPGGMLIGALAGIYPAVVASRLEPSDALRSA